MNKLTDYMTEKYNRYGYEEVITPQIFSSKLWDLSGHSSHFKENIFFTENDDNKIFNNGPNNNNLKKKDKEYNEINNYKPSGNLVYNQDLFVVFFLNSL